MPHPDTPAGGDISPLWLLVPDGLDSLLITSGFVLFCFFRAEEGVSEYKVTTSSVYEGHE